MKKIAHRRALAQFLGIALRGDWPPIQTVVEGELAKLRPCRPQVVGWFQSGITFNAYVASKQDYAGAISIYYPFTPEELNRRLDDLQRGADALAARKRKG